MKRRLISTLLSVALVLFTVTSCDRAGQGGGAFGGGADSSATGGGTFLRNRNSEFNRWLDEAFEVDYRHMTPQLIFDQVPINQIRYEIVSLPAAAPSFNFSSPNITRRDLLRAISQHWNLKMSLVTERGRPVAVRVEG